MFRDIIFICFSIFWGELKFNSVQFSIQSQKKAPWNILRQNKYAFLRLNETEALLFPKNPSWEWNFQYVFLKFQEWLWPLVQIVTEDLNICAWDYPFST